MTVKRDMFGVTHSICLPIRTTRWLLYWLGHYHEFTTHSVHLMIERIEKMLTVLSPKENDIIVSVTVITAVIAPRLV